MALGVDVNFDLSPVRRDHDPALQIDGDTRVARAGAALLWKCLDLDLRQCHRHEPGLRPIQIWLRSRSFHTTAHRQSLAAAGGAHAPGDQASIDAVLDGPRIEAGCVKRATARPCPVAIVQGSSFDATAFMTV